jgi:hypothetical protein
MSPELLVRVAAGSVFLIVLAVALLRRQKTVSDL